MYFLCFFNYNCYRWVFFKKWKSITKDQFRLAQKYGCITTYVIIIYLHVFLHFKFVSIFFLIRLIYRY